MPSWRLCRRPKIALGWTYSDRSWLLSEKGRAPEKCETFAIRAYLQPPKFWFQQNFVDKRRKFDAAKNFRTWQYNLPATRLPSAMATPRTSELQHTVWSHFLMQNTSLYVTDWPSLNGTSVLIAHKEINIFWLTCLFGPYRLVLSWFWQYMDQSDSKYYRNLHDAIYTLCKGNSGGKHSSARWNEAARGGCTLVAVCHNVTPPPLFGNSSCIGCHNINKIVFWPCKNTNYCSKILPNSNLVFLPEWWWV